MVDRMQKIEAFPDLKILGDSRRLAILRLLMTVPATLSQLGKSLDMSPARVRHHLKQLENAGLVQLVSTRVVRGFVEKYYQATARAYWVNMTLVPEQSQHGLILVFGSHDPALDLLAARMRQDHKTPDMFALPVGSLDGLIALRQGTCHIAGCHLFDPDTGEYNISYVRHLFPGQTVKRLTLLHREQGLLVRPGNPRQIRGIDDLVREDVTYINRKRGSGTRLWLDQQLETLGLESTQIRGYTNEVGTHLKVAEAVVQGLADTGLGVLAAARQQGLDFIPLFEERFDLVLLERQAEDALLDPLYDILLATDFHNAVESLGGYNTTHTGEHNLI